jgi:predicted transcriptional regulator
MENALQHALKEAIKTNAPAWYDDEPATQASQGTQHNAPQAQATPAPVATPQPSIPKENSMQNTPKLGEKVHIIYSALVQHPDISALDLETMLKGQGHEWWDSVSSQLHQLHERGLVVRVKRVREDASQGPRRVYRYWPIANTYEEAMASKKASGKKPKTTSFPINKKKAVKEKATQGLVPVQAYAKLPQEVVEQPRQKVMLRVGGFDAKAQVERMSVIEARAVYAELKAIFG